MQKKKKRKKERKQERKKNTLSLFLSLSLSLSLLPNPKNWIYGLFQMFKASRKVICYHGNVKRNITSIDVVK